MALERIVVVGASLAGLRTAEALRREGFTGQLTIVGNEEHFPPYDRPPLSKEILRGEWGEDRGRLKVADNLDATLRMGTWATGVDLKAGVVHVDHGPDIDFDAMVVATGALPRHLAQVPDDLEGVHVLRTFDDCVALRDALVGNPRVVVIGAGFIGAEVAATCRERGVDVTVVEFLAWPMLRVLGSAMGEWAAGVHRGHGVDLRLGVGTKAVLAEGGRVRAVVLEDDTEVPADIVVVAVGVEPATGWLVGSGLTLENGVMVDSTLRAIGAENVVAVGDVARWFNPMFDQDMRIEHWTNAVEQSFAAAKTLMRPLGEAEPFSSVPYVWSDQYDLKLQYVGIAGEFHEVVEGSFEDKKFVATFASAGRFVGALCVNSPARMNRYKRRIGENASIDSLAGNLP